MPEQMTVKVSKETLVIDCPSRDAYWVVPNLISFKDGKVTAIGDDGEHSQGMKPQIAIDPEKIDPNSTIVTLYYYSAKAQERRVNVSLIAFLLQQHINCIVQLPKSITLTPEMIRSLEEKLWGSETIGTVQIGETTIGWEEKHHNLAGWAWVALHLAIMALVAIRLPQFIQLPITFDMPNIMRIVVAIVIVPTTAFSLGPIVWTAFMRFLIPPSLIRATLTHRLNNRQLGLSRLFVNFILPEGNRI